MIGGPLNREMREALRWSGWASWGHALAGSDSGKEHVHLVMTSFTVSNRNNDILFESTVRRKDSIHIGAYLWNDLAQSPRYVGEERIVTQSSTGRFLPFTITLVFHLAEETMDVYINHVLIKEGKTFENLPPTGQLDYAISLYFHGAGHSGDVYWESVRVAKIGR